jgi:hypothetical protein
MRSTHLAKIIRLFIVVLSIFLLFLILLGKINGKAIFGKFTKDYSKIQIKESSKP